LLRLNLEATTPDDRDAHVAELRSIITEPPAATGSTEPPAATGSTEPPAAADRTEA
jgi:hypothetical protein